MSGASNKDHNQIEGAAVQTETQNEAPASRIWATKGIEIWALISALLVRHKPESILEFGGGRSSTFLADYAARYRKPYVCIEQSAEWAEKIRSDLKFMHVTAGQVHHVPVVPVEKGPPWYDPALVRAAIGNRAYDLVFVDGPSGGGRSSPVGTPILVRASRGMRLCIVDDVNRPSCLKVADRLTAAIPEDAKFYFIYRNQAILFASVVWRDSIAEAFAFLGLARATREAVEALAPKRPVPAEASAA